MSNDFYNPKNIDIAKIRWGFPPAPLLPRSLRTAFSTEKLPAWLSNELNLSSDATLGSLGPEVWNNAECMGPRTRHYLLFTVKTDLGRKSDIKCFDYSWPLGLKPSEIGWSARTVNCLNAYGLLSNPSEMMELTFGELFRMEGAGSLVALDFSATLEGAIDQYNQLLSDYGVAKQTAEELALILEEEMSRDWSKQISEEDPRFAMLLPPNDSGTVFDRIERVLSYPEAVDQVSKIPPLANAIDAIKERTRLLAKLHLEDSLCEFLESVSESKGDRLQAFIARFGWGGRPMATLEEAGQRIGVTRERIRQIQKKILDQLPKHDVFMPKLDRALRLLEDSTPLSLAQASRKIRSSGLSKSAFDIGSLLNAALLLNKKTSLKIREFPSRSMLVKDNADDWIATVFKRARRLAGKSGVSSVYQVQTALVADGYEVSDQDIRRVLRSESTVDFLDENWFWVIDIPLPRNRLRNVAVKILSVVSPQPVTSVRDGVRRNFKYRSASGGKWLSLVVPPLDVMKQFFEKHSEFQVVDETVHLRNPQDYKNVLGDAERAMVDVLASSPSGVLDRNSFAEACISRGMNENTFSLFTSYSPVVEHAGVELWKLRGTRIDPAYLEAYRGANNLGKRERRAMEHGWNEQGALWLAIELPKFGKSSLVVYAPAAIQRFLAGQRFDAFAKDSGEACGTVAFQATGNSYGYGVFINKYGLDENDVLLAEFDLPEGKVLLSVGTDDLLYS
jgi:hypothetical protein